MRIRTALPAIAAGAALLTLTAACSSSSKSASTTAAAVTTAAPAATTGGSATTVAPSASTGAPTGDTSSASGAPAAGGTKVDIAGFKFGPAEITIAVGDTVTWTNSDKQAHTATASGKFDTGSIAPGKTGTAKFDTAGTYTYICSFHPFMKGTIVVK